MTGVDTMKCPECGNSREFTQMRHVRERFTVDGKGEPICLINSKIFYKGSIRCKECNAVVKKCEVQHDGD